jgi:hypothetical protein
MFTVKRKLLINICLSLFVVLSTFAQDAKRPSPRSGYSLAYDANRKVVVLFGGQDTSNARLSDTWEWANGIWKPVNVTGPSARMNAAMGYDPNKHLIFLFGGRTETGTENDLWTYDGKLWSKITPSASPVARQLGVMAFDKHTSQFILFGGMDASKNPLGDTWALKNNQWTQIEATGPVARTSACMTYDDALGGVVMYGGYIHSAASKEFWEFKDGAWQDLTQESGPVRIHASLAYDPARRRLLMFGGFGEQTRTDELWEYTDHRWTQVSAGGVAPAPRAEHRSVFIPGKGLFVFGGVIGPDANTRNRGNDSWLYDSRSWKTLE